MKAAVLTDHPIAFHSPDHQFATDGGAANDNSRHPGFNEKLKALYPDKKLNCLDIGCAGGGLVKSLIDDGHFAIGLEGCDYCKVHNKFEWATIPDNLFNADLTKPFTIELRPEDEAAGETRFASRVAFDIVTAWEVMEHFLEEELPQVITNVLNHLKDDGLWIMSVSQQADRRFHRCLHDQRWWEKKFAEFGLAHRPDLHSFFSGSWVRGPERTPWAFDAPDSFHLVLERVKS